MKQILVFSLLLVVSVPLLARTGGPDDYGYMFTDEVEFSWIDEEGAVAIGLSGDDDFLQIPLPFSFGFYGERYDSIFCGTNGLLSFFEEEADAYWNEPIPATSTPNGIIAPFWDDCNVRDESEVLVKTVDSVFVIIYKNVFCPFSSMTNPLTFEVLLINHPEGDGDIVFQYLDAEVDDVTHTHGGGATVGIENEDGTVGLQYSYNEAVVDSGLAIRFFFSGEINNVSAMEILSPAGVVIGGEEITPKAVFRNCSDSSVDFTAFFRIQDTTGTLVYIDSFDVSSLGAGERDTVEFAPWMPEMGDFIATAWHNFGGDELPADDTTTAEFSVYEHISSGGPDDFGYTWRDSYHPGGPTPLPIDIEGATRIDISGDDVTAEIPLPFEFPFYGSEYSSVWVSSNGFLSFESLTRSYMLNDSIPCADDPNAILALYWDDSDIDTYSDPEAGIYVKRPADDEFHIIFWHIFLPYSSATDNVTYEAILYESGRIIFNYAQTETPTYPERSMGRSATVGIESPDGITGLLYEYNGEPPANLIYPDFAIEFSSEPVVDTIPPAISHTPPAVLYSTEENFIVQATITDISGVIADTLFFSVTGLFTPVSHDSVVGSNYYYTLPVPPAGMSICYRFLAVDGAEGHNVGYLPGGDSSFCITVVDPHFGGPDEDGFYFADSDAPDSIEYKPVFDWVELDPALGGEGEVLPVRDDCLSDIITLPLPSVFYGVDATALVISSNGFVSFDTTLTFSYAYNRPLPSEEAPSPIIAPLWLDLVPPEDSTGLFFWVDESGGRLIIEWKDFHEYADTVPMTFEAAVYFGLEYPYIKFQYLELPEELGATVGIQNWDGTSGVQYFYDGVPGCLLHDSLAVIFSTNPTYVPEVKSVPQKLALHLPYPNPFNSVVQIRFDVPEGESASVELYNILGERVDVPVREAGPGRYTVSYRADNLPSGVYMILLRGRDTSLSRKLLYLK